MKSIALFIYCFLSIASIPQTFAQSKETRKLIKNIQQTIKKKSIVSDAVDWAKLNSELKSIAYTNTHSVDKERIYTVFTDALKLAGDNHSLFLSERVSSSIDKLNNEIKVAESKYLGTNIGYLKIPSCMTFDNQKDVIFTDTIIRQIKTLDMHHIDKWIIDLRDNRGGNVWPMLSGLTPIIGDGLINYSIHNGAEKANFIKQGYISNTPVSTSIYRTKAKFKKISVLINQHTASSGEMLAISLLGFENTKAFGSKSYGLTTVNSTFHFKDGTMLFLATGYMADKQKHIYHNGITPDINLENELSEEMVLQTVMQWLNE